MPKHCGETMVLYPPDHPTDALVVSGETTRAAVRRYFLSRVSEDNCIVQYGDGRQVRYTRGEVGLKKGDGHGSVERE